MEKTTEQKVADAILERDVAQVRIGGKLRSIAPPTVATLILVSEAVSQLPRMEKAIAGDGAERRNRIFEAALSGAKGYRGLGDIAAILLLGAKEAERKPPLWRRLLRLPSRRQKLARQALESLTSAELFSLLVKSIGMLDLASFFALTTSLSDASATRPTREVAD